MFDRNKDHMTPELILADPSASFWLKDALKGALKIDPVDAANQAELLALVLSNRADKHLNTLLAKHSSLTE